MTTTKARTQSSTLSVRRDGRRLDLFAGERPLIRDLGLQLGGEGWSAHVFRDGEPVLEESEGRDAFGDYTACSVLSRFEGRDTDHHEARRSPAYTAGLRFRFYRGRGLAACWLVYEGAEPLAPGGAARACLPLLQAFERGLASWRSNAWWTKPLVLSNPRHLPSPCQHLLWQRADGHYGVLLPLGGAGAKAALDAPGGDFGVDLASGAPGFRGPEAPFFVVGLGEDCFDLNESAFALASVAMGGAFRPRKDKAFPALFEGIGWCNWNACYYDVTEEKLMASARSFAAAAFPVRYFLIDDGWSQLKDDPRRPVHPDKPWPGTARMLWDFAVDPAKFPHGLRGVVERLREACGVAQVGVWHAFLGYWSYVHPESPLAHTLGYALMPSAGGGLVPDPREGRALRFYEGWHRYLASEGVGFLKVDDQSSVQHAYKGLLPLADAARALEDALQSSVDAHFGGTLINCMAMSWENVSAMDRTAVIRSSNDFLPNVPDNGPQHLVCNVYNSLWVGQVAYPDFDMFESYHPDGPRHALLRALSGGPVYFTDKPGLEDWALLRKLITADGRLLRADQPLLPTRDSLFWEPVDRPRPLKCFTLAGHGGALALLNLYAGREAFEAAFRPSDVEGLAGTRFAAYEHYSGRAAVLERDEALRLRLEPDQNALFLLAPVEDGFAALGLVEKFLAPRAVESVQRDGRDIRVQLREAGAFGFHCEAAVESVRMDGREAELTAGPGPWHVARPAQAPAGPCEVRIRLAAAP